MAEYNTNEYKNKKRRESRSKVREGMFVSDYVQTKYLHVYQEAAEAYNNLNGIYPSKPDLRRTEEFRYWKNSIAMDRSMPCIRIPKQKKRKLVHAPHRNIPIQRCVDSMANLTVLHDTENQTSGPESSPSPAESPRAGSIHQKIMQLRIPLLSPSQRDPAEPNEIPDETPVEPNEIPDETPVEPNEIPDETPVEPNEIPDETPVEPNEIPDETPVEPNEIPDEFETLNEEVIQESTDMLYPSLLDEVAPEVIDKIVAELREDPELKDIMIGVEQRLEVEEVGLDIDIPDLSDPLEDELENMMW